MSVTTSILFVYTDQENLEKNLGPREMDPWQNECGEGKPNLRLARNLGLEKLLSDKNRHDYYELMMDIHFVSSVSLGDDTVVWSPPAS